MDIWKCICFKKRNIKRDLHKVKSKASALESKVITLKMAACLSEQLRQLLTKQNTNRSSCFQALLILLLIIKKYVLYRNVESSKRKIIRFWFIFKYFFPRQLPNIFYLQDVWLLWLFLFFRNVDIHSDSHLTKWRHLKCRRLPVWDLFAE